MTGALRPRAYKVMVDVDAAELAKPTLTIDLPVHADAAAVIDGLRGWPRLGAAAQPTPAGWPGAGSARRALSGGAARVPGAGATGEPVLLRRRRCSRSLADDDARRHGDATACIATFQAAGLQLRAAAVTRTPAAPRWATTFRPRSAPRGAGPAPGGLPGRRRQHPAEHPGAADHRRPWPAGEALRAQQRWLSLDPADPGELLFRQSGRRGPESGVTFPDFGRLAHGYGIPFRRCDAHDGLAGCIAGPSTAPARRCARSCSIPNSRSAREFPRSGCPTAGWSRAAGGHVPIPVAREFAPTCWWPVPES